MRIDFRILGPLELSVDGRVLPLGSPKQRALLALLLLHANETVSRDRLIEELWGDAAPATVESAFHVYLSRLRRLLDSAGDGGALVRHAHGYSLRIEPDQLDAQRFARLASEGSEALASGEAELAADRFRQALALWRGPPLADLESESFAVAANARLDEERVLVLEQRLEADLALGQHRELVAELETLVTEYPYRERLRGQLMLALYRAGRQAEALHAYQEARHTLVEQLGIEPGQALRRLEQAILQQDGSLDLKAEPAPKADVAPREPPVHTLRTSDSVAEAVLPGARGRRWLSFGVASVAVAGLAALAAVLAFREGEAITVRPNSVAVIDPKTNKLVADVPVGRGPGAVAFDGVSVWVANLNDSTISRINPQTREVVRIIPMEDVVASDITAGGEGIWIADGPHNAVVRVSPDASRVVEEIPTGECAGLDASIAYGKGGVWFVCAATLIRVDPTNNSASAWDYAGGLPRGIAVGLGAVWVSNLENTVARINPQTKQITEPLTVSGDPRGLAIGDGAVWVSAYRGDQVSRLAARPGESITTESIPVGDGPIDVAVGAGGVWVANSRDGTVSRIDPRTREVVATIPVGNSPRGIAVGANLIWVTVQAPEKGGLQR
jgi:YVTN family beta-propeller protein